MSDLRPIENTINAKIGDGRYVIFKEVEHVLIFAACTNYQHFSHAYKQIYGNAPDSKTYLHYMAKRPELRAVAATTLLSDGTTLEQYLKERLNI